MEKHTGNFVLQVWERPVKDMMPESKRQSQTDVMINDTSQGSVATHSRCG